ncbi:MAG: hypothetical protein ACRD5M_11050 [Candidatus Acidiferrales bacterium]
MYTCRECEQTVNQATEVCPYCGADLTASPATEPGAPAKKSSPVRTIIILGFVVAFLWAIAWFAVPWRITGSKAESQAIARSALTSIQEVLATYQSSEGSFPPSLDALGDRVRVAVQIAQSADYTLQYIPGQPAEQGRIKSYALTARSGKFGYLNLYTDESGVMRVTREARAATVQDAPLEATP